MSRSCESPSLDSLQLHEKLEHPIQIHRLASQHLRYSLPHLRDNTPSPNGSSLPYRHPRQDRHIPSNPAVLADVDFLPILRPVGSIPQGRIQRMSPAVQTDIGPEHGPRSNGHQTGVDDDAVEVDEDALAQFHVEPVVNSHRGLNPRLILKESLVFVGVISWRRKRCLVIDDTAPLVWLASLER